MISKIKSLSLIAALGFSSSLLASKPDDGSFQYLGVTYDKQGRPTAHSVFSDAPIKIEQGQAGEHIGFKLHEDHYKADPQVDPSQDFSHMSPEAIATAKARANEFWNGSVDLWSDPGNLYFIKLSLNRPSNHESYTRLLEPESQKKLLELERRGLITLGHKKEYPVNSSSTDVFAAQSTAAINTAPVADASPAREGGLNNNGASGSGDASQDTHAAATNFWDSPFSQFQTKEGIEHIQHLVDTDSPELRNSRAQSALAVLENSGKIVIPRKTNTPRPGTAADPAPNPPINPQDPVTQSSFIDDTGKMIKAAYIGTQIASAIGDLFPSAKKAWRDYAGHDPQSPEYQKAIKDSIEANTIHVPTAQEREAWRSPELDNTTRELNNVADRLTLLRQQIHSDQLQIQNFSEQGSLSKRFLTGCADAFVDGFTKSLKKDMERRFKASVDEYLRQRAVRMDVASRKQNYEAAFKNPRQTVENGIKNFMQHVSGCSYQSLIEVIDEHQKDLARIKSKYTQLTGKSQLYPFATITQEHVSKTIAYADGLPLDAQSTAYYYAHKSNELEVVYAITEQCIEKLKDLKAISEINIKKKIDQFNGELEKNSLEGCAKELKELNVIFAVLEKEQVSFADSTLKLQKELEQINNKIESFNGNYAQRGWANVKGYWRTSESYESLKACQNQLQKIFVDSSARREETIDKLIVANGQRECIYRKYPSLKNTFYDNLTQARDAYYKLLRTDYFSAEDQKLLTIMNQAIANPDNERRPFSDLTTDAKDLLRMCNISPDVFDKMMGNKFQEHLYDTTTNILLDQARSLKLHQGNQEIVEYINATTNMSAAALDMMRNGRPVEAIATVKMAQQFSKATEIAIGVVQGGAKGIGVRALGCVAARFLPPQAQLPLLILSGADMAYRATTMSKRYEEFMALPPRQQAETISQFVTAYGIDFLNSCSYFHKAWKGASKIIRGPLKMFGGHLPPSQSTLRLSGATAVANTVRKPIDISIARQVTPEMIAAKYAQEASMQPLFTTRMPAIPVASGAPAHLDPLKVYQSLSSTVFLAQSAVKDAAIRAQSAAGVQAPSTGAAGNAVDVKSVKEVLVSPSYAESFSVQAQSAANVAAGASDVGKVSLTTELRQSILNHERQITIEEAHKLGFRGETIKRLTEANKSTKRIGLNTEFTGGIEKARQMFDTVRKEFESRTLIKQGIDLADNGSQRITNFFEDGSLVQLRTVGKSGQPKVEITDALRNIEEKITFI